jgi:hypothetical protein
MDRQTKPGDNNYRRISPPLEKKKPKSRVLQKKEKSWIEKNLRWIAISFLVLFLGQSMRGCINTTSLEFEQKDLIVERDSIYGAKDQQILDLQSLLDDAQGVIQEQSYGLKLAGVKAEEADRRAKAIQETAQKIRQNTTIEIKADTTKNRIKHD